MSGWDEGRVYVSDQGLIEVTEAANSLSLHEVRKRFREFVRNFREGSVFPYRDQLLTHYRKREFWIDVDVANINVYDELLGSLLQSKPAEVLPQMEAGAKEALLQLILEVESEQSIPEIQIILSSNQQNTSIRELNAVYVSKMIQLSGIVISQTRSRPKATHLTIRCKSCQNVKKIPCSKGFGGAQIPRTCDSQQVDGSGNTCPLDPYVIVSDKSDYIDQQTMKLQEAPEDCPTGEMPRSILLAAERNIVNKVTPGTRVTVLGIYSIFQSRDSKNAGAVAIRNPYIRVVGLSVDENNAGRGKMSFTEEEEEQIVRLLRQPKIYDTLASSIAPSIYGEYTEDIKKALACLLFGGSRRMLPDGSRLRGDINVLLLGDPSTAKSQFLKFIEKVSPVGVYTSGKGSSAAGLTAAVIRDASGEFCLEGGAMVLGDGGVVCIDEFDKMRDMDRVAIHEAMEQQTISIAKAGITTVLNSRTSVLAAANPIFGRYDNDRDAGENIDFQTTILSRFDLIFVVKDVRDEEKDRNMAKHVMSIHLNSASSLTNTQGDIDIAMMKKIVAYCRCRCAPTLSLEASEQLKNHYVSIREQVRRRETETGNQQTIPITVRQLEAIIRLSEALAKMSLSPEATVDHVNEAIRLFRVSTLSAATSDAGMMSDGVLGTDQRKKAREAEEIIRSRLGIGSMKNRRALIEELVGKGFPEPIAMRAMSTMLRQGELDSRSQGRYIIRLK